ncbi:MAG: hypothetical protein PSN34_05910 [Urechidicola sp.]|nr:hypothetical protein [Urechidicola sp.]
MNLISERKRYKEGLENPTQEDIDLRSYDFALFSANIKRFFPKIKNSDYFDLFKKCLYNKWISSIEQFDTTYLRNTAIVNHSSIDLKSTPNKPIIFTSFHYGSYRLFNSTLYELGYKIVIIMDEGVIKRQGNQLLNEVKPLLKGTENSDFIILNVMDRTSIFKLKKLISEGYVMSVYLDGNMGINDDNKSFSKGYIPINLFDKTVYVKNGIGKLASILGAMLIPTISYKDVNEDNHLTFYKEIQISDFKNKQEFSIKSIELVYQIFFDLLKKDPMQWSSWLDIHLWFKRDFTTPFKNTFLDQEYIKFNYERYTFFKMEKSFFIFDLYDYKSYPINEKLHLQMKQNRFSEIQPNLYTELKTKNIIL